MAGFIGGSSYYNDAVAATVQQIKSGAGLINALKIVNPNASAAYLQIFGILAANVTLGTTVSDAVIPLAASETLTLPLTTPIAPGRANVIANAGLSIAGTTTYNGNTGVAVGLKVYALYE